MHPIDFLLVFPLSILVPPHRLPSMRLTKILTTGLAKFPSMRFLKGPKVFPPWSLSLLANPPKSRIMGLGTFPSVPQSAHPPDLLPLTYNLSSFLSTHQLTLLPTTPNLVNFAHHAIYQHYPTKKRYRRLTNNI